MVITELLERNSRLYGAEIALVEVNPSESRDKAVTWREASLIENTSDAPFRREMSWRSFDQRANRIANLLLSRGIKRGTKVGILMMNCLEYLPTYFGILKAGCIVVPMNFRYSSEEINDCVDLADVEVLVFGPERGNVLAFHHRNYMGNYGINMSCITYISSDSNIFD